MHPQYTLIKKEREFMGEKNLVIVESPAKAKTIEKFLGKGYTVESSFGHICDLAKKNLGIDIANGFEPTYVVDSEKKKIVSKLKALSKEADTVWLASDEDREGEAIAWHLKNTLSIPDEKIKRIVFHEITKSAIIHAIENPRDVDMNLVLAQQARRVLDRLVGFELSPILWKKVAPKLSAGRVQSVAVRLIVDKEREIQDFKSSSYFRVTGDFSKIGQSEKTKIHSTLSTKFNEEKDALEFMNLCKQAKTYRVEHIDKKGITRTPAPPFTTSALQQEASRKLGLSVAQTMRIAQKLYESGLITYMRTDSTNLSSLALGTIKQAIIESYGEKYSKVRQYKTHSKGAQEAHEAIRPTDALRKTIDGTPQEKRLYELIWKRALSSQMADAQLEKTTITIGGDNFSQKFISEGEQVKFDGFLKLYLESKDDENEDESENQILPAISQNDELEPIEISATQKFTLHPARYSEATLVKKLEELGIGRPSTYAPTISTITARGYVVKDSREGTNRNYIKIVFDPNSQTIKTNTLSETAGAEKNKFFPQDVGILVTEYLKKNFESILDYGFTAKIEEDFDKVAEGKLKWNGMIADFYSPFHQKVEQLEQEKGHVNTERVLGIDPASGLQISVRLGKFGPIAQKGDAESKDKTFASLQKGQSIETITLQEAIKLFELPRTVGEYEGESLVAAIGRFGPYIKYGKKFVSIGKDYDPLSITLDQAISLIKEKEEKAEKAVIKTFEAEDIQILNGRFGPYIKHAGGNYKIPKGKGAKSAEELTLDDCKKIIESTTPTGLKKTKK